MTVSIDKARVIALKKARSAYRSAYKQIIEIVQRERELVKNGSHTPEQGLHNIMQLINDKNLVKDKAINDATVAIESHFISAQKIHKP